MKRFVITAMAVCLALVFVDCKSQPKTNDDAFKDVYDRYKSGLILDGAGSYTVKSGDTLAHIARDQYAGFDHSGFYFPVIMLASSDVVLDPDKIQPGMKLTIPDLQRNLDDSRAKEQIKSYLNEIAKIEDDRNRPLDAQGLRDLSNSL